MPAPSGRVVLRSAQEVAEEAEAERIRANRESAKEFATPGVVRPLAVARLHHLLLPLKKSQTFGNYRGGVLRRQAAKGKGKGPEDMPPWHAGTKGGGAKGGKPGRGKGGGGRKGKW